MHLRSFRHAAALLSLLALTSQALPQQASAPLASSRALLESGKIPAAEQQLRSWLQAHPDSADGHFLLGYALFREQRAADSLAEFTLGAKFRRPSTGDFKVIAADYVLLGDFTDAARWLTVAAQQEPSNPDTWYLLARAQYNENRFADAITSFQRVLALEPRSVRAENNLGLCYQGLQQNAAAKAAYQTAIVWQQDAAAQPDKAAVPQQKTAQPHPSAQPYLNLGSILLDEEQSAQAFPLLKQAAALAPDNPKAHEQLGRAYEALHQYSAAQAEYERAIALAPRASGLHFKLGQIYRREGLSQQAQQQFDQCAKLNSTHSSIETPNPPSH